MKASLVHEELESNKREGFVIITAASDEGMVDIYHRKALVLSPEHARELARLARMWETCVTKARSSYSRSLLPRMSTIDAPAVGTINVARSSAATPDDEKGSSRAEAQLMSLMAWFDERDSAKNFQGGCRIICPECLSCFHPHTSCEAS